MWALCRALSVCRARHSDDDDVCSHRSGLDGRSARSSPPHGCATVDMLLVCGLSGLVVTRSSCG